jgi:mannose/cellobiose epimerase-like protein (N-acyl-D-glucosamine 2-epimerase family)
MPNFRSPDFLTDHILHTLAFYEPRSLDATGGFFHFYKDDGTVYDRRTRHLVSSTRFVFNNAMAYRRFGNPEHLAAVRHGLAFLHRGPREARGRLRLAGRLAPASAPPCKTAPTTATASPSCCSRTRTR